MLGKPYGVRMVVCVTGALLLSACGSAGRPVEAGQAVNDRSASMAGQDKASRAPGMAHVSIGVETTARSSKAAVAANNQQVAALVKKLEALGIAEADIQAGHPSLSSQRPEMAVRSVDGDKGGGVIYHVSNQVDVTVRDVDKLGDVLAVANENTHTIYGLYYDVAAPRPLAAAAREKALADAQARAESLARLHGVSVDEVLIISRLVGSPRPILDEPGDGEPVQPGEFQVHVSVRVTYAIK